MQKHKIEIIAKKLQGLNMQKIFK